MNPFRRRTDYRADREYEYSRGHGKHARPYEGNRRWHHKFGRRNGESREERRAAGYKAALSNPNTTRRGREHAKHELRHMGRGREAHVPLLTKIKRTLGIRSTPRRQRNTEIDRRRY